MPDVTDEGGGTIKVQRLAADLDCSNENPVHKPASDSLWARSADQQTEDAGLWDDCWLYCIWYPALAASARGAYVGR